MYWPDRGSGVPVEPARRPVASAVRQYFTEGGAGQAPTVPGGDWFNQITNELLNVLAAAGIDPSKEDDDQLLQAILRVSNAIVSREALRRSYEEAGYLLRPEPESFRSGGTLTSAFDVLLDEASGKAYSWPGPYPHTVDEDTDPAAAGSGYISQHNALLKTALAKAGGVSLVKGAKAVLKTSDYVSLSATLDAALSLGADVLIDNVQNLTAVITKNLNGKDLTISATPDGWVNFTPSDPDTYYQIITLTGTGVESVHTDINLDGGKVRGVGSAIVGIVVNNVYWHRDSSEMKSVSACVNTVKSEFHICHGAKYYDVHQQLASQSQFAGVYGYGSVPIDCVNVIIFGNQFGATGAPIDRHPVYVSSYDDGTGYCVNAFVYDNAVVMRDYKTETPETTFERAFKFVGTKRVHIHDNELEGGYGLALITLRKHQTMDFVGISDNRGRTFAEVVTITSQDSTADEPDATWQLADLVLGGNDVRLQTTTPSLAVGVRYRNVSRIQDKASHYYNEAYAVANALSVYVAKTDRVRATFIDSQACHYDKFQNVFRGEEPISLFIDIVAMRPDSANSPLVPTVIATNRNLLIRAIDNSAAWKSGFLSSQVSGFSYYDAAFGRYITSAGAGTWTDDRGFQVVGLSTSRPGSVPVGHIFYQTDDANYVRWTGSTWILTTAPWSGIITFGTTAQINAVNKLLLGYGHMIYNTDTKKPAFFDALAQAWKYADGTAM